jgi:hypothetical protein
MTASQVSVFVSEVIAGRGRSPSPGMDEQLLTEMKPVLARLHLPPPASEKTIGGTR